jgi:hypothetical protein
MPIRMSIEKLEHVVLISVEGPVSVDTFLTTLERAWSHTDYHAGMNSLIDLREATHNASVEDVARIARYVADNQQRVQGGKTAIVVTRTVTYGLMKMFQTRVSSLPLELMVFYDMGKARRWLGLQV